MDIIGKGSSIGSVTTRHHSKPLRSLSDTQILGGQFTHNDNSKTVSAMWNGNCETDCDGQLGRHCQQAAEETTSMLAKVAGFITGQTNGGRKNRILRETSETDLAERPSEPQRQVFMHGDDEHDNCLQVHQKEEPASAVQGGDEEWPVQMARSVSYIAGTLNADIHENHGSRCDRACSVDTAGP
jgi:hypothetical protein